MTACLMSAPLEPGSTLIERILCCYLQEPSLNRIVQQGYCFIEMHAVMSVFICSCSSLTWFGNYSFPIFISYSPVYITSSYSFVAQFTGFVNHNSLLVYNYWFTANFHRFRDTTNYWSKITHCSHYTYSNGVRPRWKWLLL